MSISEPELDFQPSVHLVKIGNEVFPLVVSEGQVGELAKAFAAHVAEAASLLVLCDPSVTGIRDSLLSAVNIRVNRLNIEVVATESAKNLGIVERIISEAVQGGVDRNSIVVGIGGGLTMNVAGLVAGLMFRGLRLIHVPTTPVGAFDAVLSLKQGVNLPALGKNLIGLYKAPEAAFCDLSWLTYMSPAQMRAGCMEMAKNVLAVCPEHTADLKRALATTPPRMDQLLKLGVAAKQKLLDIDPHETGDALVFEYGHTIGHAVELLSGGDVGHGDAVGFGMLVAADVAISLGIAKPLMMEQHLDVIGSVGSKIPDVSNLASAEILQLLARDNKRGLRETSRGTVPMVLLKELGAPAVVDGLPLTDVPIRVVAQSVEAMQQRFEEEGA